jgi:hypothetical protein
MAMLSTHNRELEQLTTEALGYKLSLQQIYPGVNADDSKLITSVLAKHASPVDIFDNNHEMHLRLAQIRLQICPVAAVVS